MFELRSCPLRMRLLDHQAGVAMKRKTGYFVMRRLLPAYNAKRTSMLQSLRHATYCTALILAEGMDSGTVRQFITTTEH